MMLRTLLILAFLSVRVFAVFNVGNFVWEDLNENGVQDSGEPGIEGVTVELWDSTKTQLIGSTLTNSNGIYTLTGPTAGDYRIRVGTLYPADRFTLKDQGADTTDSDINASGVDAGFTDVFTVAPNVISINTKDAGVILDPMRDHNIGDYVFKSGATGTQPGASAFGNVTVQLLGSDGSVLQTTVSAPNGFYSFKASPGTYRLRFIASAGWIPTPHPDAGMDDTIDSDIDSNGLTPLFTIPPGKVLRDLDAGFVLICNVGNFVWNDLDGDGVQDAGEPGVADVLVELWDDTKTRRYGATTTNSSGIYTLQAPGPGDYRLFVLRPSPDDSFSPKDLGSDTTDSDINTGGADLGFTDVFTIGPNLISITTKDAGMKVAVGPRDLTPLRMTEIQRLNATAYAITFTAPIGAGVVIESSTEFPIWKEAVPEFTISATSTTRSVKVTGGAQAEFWRVRRVR